MGRHKQPKTTPVGSPLTAVPKPPAGLGSVGRAKWHRTAEVLMPAGLLTACDVDALETYCRAWDEVSDCDKALEDHGAFFVAQSGYVGQHPAVSRRHKAYDVIRRFHQAFGMTPQARNAVTVAQRGEDEADAEFFG